jgi:hypothetical protein
MNSVSGQVADSLAAAYDFSQFRTIVDVGGGGGALPEWDIKGQALA